MKNLLEKLLNVPGPADLGMGDSNYAMPSEFVSNHDGKPTWEDYERRIKQDYPVKHFFLYTASRKIRHTKNKVIKPFNDAVYWAKCNFLPAHKYHLIDLRGSVFDKDSKPYSHGWLDTDTKMEFAMFKLLSDFVEKEATMITQEDVDAAELGYDKEAMQAQKESCDRIMEIYNYWKTDRFVLDKAHEEALHLWCEYEKAHPGILNEVQQTELNQLHETMRETEKVRDEKLNEMLHKLVDLRGHLWT